MKTPINTDYETVRRPDGRFGSGNCANPVGRPRGSLGGRQQALKILDAILAEVGTQERLAAALKEHLEEDPVRFFKTIVMPLLPTEARHEFTAEVTRIEWTRLSDVPRHGAKADDVSE